MEKLNETSHHAFVNVYGSNEVKSYVEKCAKLQKTFLNPTVGNFLEAKVPGKRFLDVGCGRGYWCYQAARYGAKSVEGFDKQEEMVKLAKEATSHFDTVNIQLGDIMDMPYDDNTFDVAISIHVTCVLSTEMLLKHFKELYRVLVPGGKALILNLSNPAFKNILMDGANEANVQEKIDQILSDIPEYPSQQQINEACKDLNEVVCVCFAYDKNGSLFHVKDVNQLTNGEAVLRKTYITTFCDFYYDDQYLLDQITAAGLKVDQVENIFTEERRIMHNILNPDVQFGKNIVQHPFYLLHYTSKPA